MTPDALVARLVEKIAAGGPSTGPLLRWVQQHRPLVLAAAGAVLAERAASVPAVVSAPPLDPVEYVRDAVSRLLGRGAPDRRDDAGFNGFDFSWFEARQAGIEREPPNFALLADAAERLVKYGRTQLDGVETVKRVAAALRAEAGVAEERHDADGRLIGWQDRNGNAFAYAPGKRDAKGRALGAGEVAVTSRAKLKELALDAGLDVLWFVDGSTWFLRVPIGRIPDLVVTLRKRKLGVLADALDRAQVDLAELEAASLTRPEDLAVTPEPSAGRGTPAAVDFSADVNDELARVLPTLYALASKKLREDPDYREAVRRTLGRELSRGLRQGAARWELADGRALELEPRQVSMALSVPWEDREWFAGEYRIAEPKKFPDNQRRWWHRVSLKRAERVAKALDTSPARVGLAAVLRYLVLVDQPRAEEKPSEVRIFSNARKFSDLPAYMRERARALGASIRVGPDVELAEYQQIGVLFAAMRGFRALIADAPGVGKTAQAIGALSYGGADMTPAVVAAPASVVYNWRDEIEKFAPWLEPVVIGASAPMPAAGPNTVYIVSTASLARALPGLLTQRLRTFIFDEADAAKSRSKKLAQRAQAALELADKVDHVLLLTGTPLRNEVAELWSLLNMIAPTDFPSFDEFVTQWGGAKRTQTRTITVGGLDYPIDVEVDADPSADWEERNAELARVLQEYMIRRRYSEVEDQITTVRGPTRERIRLDVKLPASFTRTYEETKAHIAALAAHRFEKAVYGEALAQFRSRRKMIESGRLTPERATELAFDAAAAKFPDGPQANILSELGELRRLVGEAKAPAAAQWLYEHFQRSSEPVVVFVEHQGPLQRIASALDDMRLRYGIIQGSTTPKKRHEVVSSFQGGQLDVIIITRAAETGITLTRSHHMLMLERQWVPAAEEQIEGRIARRGQTRQPLIYYFMAPNTVDDYVAELVDTKRALSTEVVGAGENAVDAESAQDLGETARGQMSDISADVRRRILAGHRVVLPSLQGFAAMLFAMQEAGTLWEGEPVRPNPRRRVR